VLVADDAIPVREVQRRREMIGVSAPDLVVVVGGDRIIDSPLLCRLAHQLELVLERELRRMDSDYDQSVVSVRLRPRADMRFLAQPVDARQRPEVHDDDVTLQLGRAEWLGVEPLGRAGERGQMHTLEQGHG
jgi:hypothetical protein